MALKTLVYLAVLFSTILGSIAYHPLVGLLAYLLAYNVNPLHHWWASALSGWALRYAFLLAVATALGMLFHTSKLRYQRLLESHEILLLMFLGFIWLSIPLGLGVNQAESHTLKMTKVVIILMMATHLVTDLRRYEMIIWVLIVAGLYLGVQTYVAPPWLLRGSRILKGVGGSDFGEGNFLASHFAMLLPFIGIMFLKGRWKSKAICVISGAFVTNGIILCRSRGVFLSLIIGVICAVTLAHRVSRKKILFGMCAGLLAAFLLTDPGFWKRMELIEFNAQRMDGSSRGRLEAWRGALAMASDHPLGIGEGNFKEFIAQYEPKMAGKDTHNTFLRCLTELGVQGLLVLLLLIGNAFRLLTSISKQAEQTDKKEDFLWHIYAVRIALIMYLVSGLFITHTYIEEFYWLLMFPLFLKRSVQNEVYAL